MIPHAMQWLDRWREARRHAGRMLVALDYDGTLAPIVPRPEEATIPAPTRAALHRLDRRPDTDLAIVSGRTLEDVRARVDLPGIFIAGNHGMEIEGPGVQQVHRDAARARPRLAACAATLRRIFADEPDVAVEDKGLTLSVHYRRLRDPEAAERARVRAREACRDEPGLRVTEGKKVIEIRPDVDWDKGRAVRFLLDALEAGEAAPRIPAIYIGDDRTDEDAFRALRGRGDGVLVAAEPPEDTEASAFLRSTEEVAALLDALAEPV